MSTLYRAKLKDSKDYVIGFLCSEDTIKSEEYLGFGINGSVVNAIDKSTLSISLKNMIDKNNERVFASLQENGKGGDLLRNESELETYVLEISTNGTELFEYLDNNKIKNFVSRFSNTFSLFNELKVIGIK